MILVDGVEDAGVPADDRALAYGDGIFRTLEIRAGVARHWPEHYAKLAADCARLGLSCPAEPTLASDIQRVSSRTSDCTLKVIISRGSTVRGYVYSHESSPRRIVIASPPAGYPAAYSTQGVRVRRCRLRLAQQPALAGVKHLNRLENVLARAEWTDPEIAEGLLLDTDGHVIGGTMTNLFIAKAGTLVTPKLDRCGVAGVTRQRAMSEAAHLGVPCHVADISWNDVLGADEAILVNSLAGAWSVREIDGSARVPGPLGRAMQQWLAQD